MRNKDLLRHIIRERLEKMDLGVKRAQSELIFEKVKQLQLPEGSICIYNSLPNEVDTRPIIDYFIGKRKVYLPVVDREDIMLVEVNENTGYREAKWGIFEPIGEKFEPEDIKPAVTIAPLLAVDENRNRLGKGKAFYDRYFDRIDTLKIGLAFDEQIVDSVPCEMWDIPLDVVVTPVGNIEG